jgi:hypothetical protein
MLDQIKESLAQFQKEKGSELSLRDTQGIAKINSELDLLSERHKKEPAKSKRAYKVGVV